MKNLYFAYKRNNHITNILITILVILIFVVQGCASVVKNTTNDVKDTTVEEINLGDEYIQYGAMFFMNKQYDIALELFEKALKEFQATYGKKHPKVAGTYFNIGTTYFMKGDPLKGKSYYKSAMEICENDNSKPCPEIREGIRNNLNLLNRYEQQRKTDISL